MFFWFIHSRLVWFCKQYSGSLRSSWRRPSVKGGQGGKGIRGNPFKGASSLHHYSFSKPLFMLPIHSHLLPQPPPPPLSSFLNLSLSVSWNFTAFSSSMHVPFKPDCFSTARVCCPLPPLRGCLFCRWNLQPRSHPGQKPGISVFFIPYIES